MENFTKEIVFDNNKRVKYSINNEGYIPIHTVKFQYIDDYPKTITFNRWDDYSFRSWFQIDYEDYINKTKETHIFTKNNPLYMPLLHLLKGEKELIIDDDETVELEKKYLKIYKNEDNINIDFIYELNDKTEINKFYAFIKNIGLDYRSKIDCLNKDTKERLYFFFKELHDRFSEEYHQMEIDEYLESINELSLEESKKYVKQFKDRFF